MKKEIETLRILWNGIKVNGDLVKLSYSLHDGEIHVSFNDGWYEPVAKSNPWNAFRCAYLKNGYDAIMIQNFEEDCPIYEYLYNAYWKAQAHYLEKSEKDGVRYGWGVERIAEYKAEKENALKNVKKLPSAVPTEVLESFKKWKAALAAEEDAAREKKEEEENAAHRAAHEEQKARREMWLEPLKEKFPQGKEKYTVKIKWSESPSLMDGEEMSFTAAEKYIGKLDKEKHIRRESSQYWGWYAKTSFEIIDAETGETAYSGRYDIGDGECGIINHIQDYLEYCTAPDVSDFWKMTQEQVENLKKFIADLKANLKTA